MSRKFKIQILVFPLGILLLHSCFLWGQDDRETWQPPEQIMDSVGVRPGMVIGEVGAGRGHFTFHLAERVGEEGKVYANDIDQYALDILSSRAEDENADNIITVLGNTDDPLFPEEDLEMIIMVYVLHHMETPVEMLNSLGKYLDPGARLVIIEKDTHKDREAYPHFMSKKQVLETIELSDFKLERVAGFLPKDTIYICRAKN